MTATAIYAYVSTALFVLLGVMLSGSHWLTGLLRTACILMALFGFIVGLANSGIVLATGIRLV